MLVAWRWVDAIDCSDSTKRRIKRVARSPRYLRQRYEGDEEDRIAVVGLGGCDARSQARTGYMCWCHV